MSTNKHNFGFTLVEVLVIAPIVILAVGTFVAVMVNMTGEVLRTREENSIVYNTQDALNTIEQDITMSGAFLAGNDISGLSPQGYAANSAAPANSFTNVGTNGNMLILRGMMTDKNPLDPARQPVYTDSPNGCAQKTQNKLFTDNIVYFVSGGSLWRRVIVQQGNGTPTLCSTPWQLPTCAAASVNKTTCDAKDTKLLDNVTTFDIVYKVNPNDAEGSTNTMNVTATNSGNSVTTRNQALLTATAAKVTLTSGKTVAGQDITHTGYLQASKINITTDTPTVVSLGIGTQPANKSVKWTDPNATFTASSNYPTGNTYKWQQLSTAVGATWTDIAGATSTSLTVAPINMSLNGYQYRLAVTNGGTTVYSNPATLTVYIWTNLSLQNGWSFYASPFATAAYTKTPYGEVFLKGLIDGGPNTWDSLIGTLPSNMWPSQRLIFYTGSYDAAGAKSGFGRIDVLTNGEIHYMSGDPNWISLDSIHFMPSGSCTFTSLTPLANGWANYGGGYPDLSVCQDASTRTHVQGLVKDGTVTAGVAIGTMPANYQPSGSYIIPAGAGPGVFNSFGVYANNNIVARGQTASYLSAMNTHYPAAYAGWLPLTLQNSWVFYGGQFNTAQYTKSADGVVSVKGLVKSGTVANGTVIANLPVGYRPKSTLLLSGVSYDAHLRVDVQADGDIVVNGGANTNWISLDAISFVAEQ